MTEALRLWPGADDNDIADDAWTDVTDDVVSDGTSWNFVADPVSMPGEFRCRNCDRRVIDPTGERWRHADTGDVMCDPDRWDSVHG